MFKPIIDTYTKTQIWCALFTPVTLVGINGVALIEWDHQHTRQNQVTTDQEQKHATKQIA